MADPPARCFQSLRTRSQTRRLRPSRARGRFGAEGSSGPSDTAKRKARPPPQCCNPPLLHGQRISREASTCISKHGQPLVECLQEPRWNADGEQTRKLGRAVAEPCGQSGRRLRLAFARCLSPCSGSTVGLCDSDSASEEEPHWDSHWVIIVRAAWHDDDDDDADDDLQSPCSKDSWYLCLVLPEDSTCGVEMGSHSSALASVPHASTARAISFPYPLVLGNLSTNCLYPQADATTHITDATTATTTAAHE
eukprot:242796-Rhodomonas_salina.2